jgi:hypoxanthine phosphoribosyltransferase
MLPDSFPVELISWERATALSRQLAGMIKASHFRPEFVVAIGRGGFVPARVVCDSLLITNLTSIRIEHWGTAATRYERAQIRFPLSIDIEGCDLLVIDDVTDTGETLGVAMEYLSKKNAGSIRSGVLQHKSSSSFVPDYYPELITEWRWIVYPWALHEDLVGFTEKLLTRSAAYPGEIYARLREMYAMNPDMPSFQEALEELVDLRKAVRDGNRFRKAGVGEK